ncbi:type II secretion system F family protein [Streptomyces gobiensis]|uniref:type II secretion system F family protein n=1 Tax=Streptomyces gobiensis TaxID=2875706 RepID=UPI001E31A6A7|nr:type II secretion system F family protein [Streptomyces gobiensis]UGY92324.1 type II secretion system F family protein [Streptomyces gobiensis]
MSAETMHRLWTTFLVALAVLTPLGAVLASRRERARGRRLATLLGAAPQPALRIQAWRPSGPWSRAMRQGPQRDGLAALGAGSLGFIFLGGVAGLLVGLAVAFGIWRWLRQHTVPGEQAAKAAQERVAAAQLPLTAELMAACLAAGSGPREAARAVGDSLGGPVGERLLRSAAELRLGAEPAAAWVRLAELPDAVALARCLERSQASGAPAVEPVSRLAAECRARQARTATARARRAGVLVTAPLGLCFLPAFLLAGVVPVVIGLATSLL